MKVLEKAFPQVGILKPHIALIVKEGSKSLAINVRLTTVEIHLISIVPIINAKIAPSSLGIKSTTRATM